MTRTFSPGLAELLCRERCFAAHRAGRYLVTDWLLALAREREPSIRGRADSRPMLSQPADD